MLGGLEGENQSGRIARLSHLTKIASIETAQTPEGDTVFRFHQPIDYEHVSALWQDVSRSFNKQQPKKLILDFNGVQVIDSAGIALLRLIWRYCHQQQIPLDYRSIPPSANYFFRFVESEASPLSHKAGLSLVDLFSAVGRFFQGMLKEHIDLIRFLGDFVRAAISSLSPSGRFRWREVLYYIQLSGSEAMPIVFLMSFLIGLVMAFQAAVQLRQFGGNIFVADLLSLALTRELGPVFTAVILAGRSGSAFAAEIGTMKVNEEVDALIVMGFDIHKFLIVPKVFALAFTGPLLTMLANGAGILGGIVVGVFALDLTARSFLEEAYLALVLTDVLSGLIKSFAFSILVALIGCFRGLQASKGADSVGRQTTSAVVSGIFLIILADAVFTVLFHVFKW